MSPPGPPSRPGIDPNLLRALGDILSDHDRKIDHALTEIRGELTDLRKRPSITPKKLSEATDHEDSGIFDLSRSDHERIRKAMQHADDAEAYRRLKRFLWSVAIPVTVVLVVGLLGFIATHIWH